MLDELASEMAGSVKIAMVNAAVEGELARRFGIRGVPAFHLYRGGSRLGETVGAMPKDQLAAWIRSLA